MAGQPSSTELLYFVYFCTKFGRAQICCSLHHLADTQYACGKDHSMRWPILGVLLCHLGCPSAMVQYDVGRGWHWDVLSMQPNRVVRWRSLSGRRARLQDL